MLALVADGAKSDTVPTDVAPSWSDAAKDLHRARQLQ